MALSLYARLHRQFGPQTDALSRRELLKAAALASGVLLLSRMPTFGDGPAKPNGIKVAVIGAGFAGLACAYELMTAGYDVRVLEARDRVGGRVLSFNDLVKGKNVEGGGELIGSNHPHWVGYKEKFGLEFLDVTEGEEGSDSPLYLGGKLLREKEAKDLYDEMTAATAKMNDDAKKVVEDEPWKTPDAAALDQKNTQQWVDAQGFSDLCKLGVVSQLEGNNGQALSKQSYLGNITQIKGGGVEKYWTDSEVYRCKGGNQSLAFKFQQALGDRVFLKVPVTEIIAQGNKMKVNCADGRQLEVDDVVLAVPPSTWGKIKFTPDLPKEINPLMGINIKYLAVTKGRFWNDKKMSPDSQGDALVSMTWEGTDNQPGEGQAELTGFSGGPLAEKARAIPAKDRDKAYADVLGKLYPGYAENFVSSRFMDWPGDPWTMAGYSFPGPGQVTTVGPLMDKGVARLHFAGEHTCYKFVGYMEGGLTSGARIAKKLAQRDGVVVGAPATQQ